MRRRCRNRLVATFGTQGERRRCEVWRHMKTKASTAGGAPNSFIGQHQADVIGHLHGFDRLRLQGTLPPLYAPDLMRQQLWALQVLHKDFKEYARGITRRMRTAL